MEDQETKTNTVCFSYKGETGGTNLLHDSHWDKQADKGEPHRKDSIVWETTLKEVRGTLLSTKF